MVDSPHILFNVVEASISKTFKFKSKQKVPYHKISHPCFSASSMIACGGFLSVIMAFSSLNMATLKK